MKDEYMCQELLGLVVGSSNRGLGVGVGFLVWASARVSVVGSGTVISRCGEGDRVTAITTFLSSK